MKTKLSGDLSISEDAAIAIDRMTLQSVYTWTQLGMTPDRCTADRAHPTIGTLGSYGPILHLALKTVPPSKGTTPELWNAPVWPHGSRSERVVSPPPLPHWYPAILLAGMVPHFPSSTRPWPHARRGGVYVKVPWKGLSTRFQTGASSYPPSASKTTTPRLWKPSK
jgi:hypothetical protein